MNEKMGISGSANETEFWACFSLSRTIPSFSEKKKMQNINKDVSQYLVLSYKYQLTYIELEDKNI